MKNVSVDKCDGPDCWVEKLKLKGAPVEGITNIVFHSTETRAFNSFGPPPPPGSAAHNAYWYGIEEAYLAQLRTRRERGNR